MAERTFAEEVGKELTGKAVIWGPALAGAAVAGPVGFFAGLMVSVAVIISSGSDTASGGSTQDRH